MKTLTFDKNPFEVHKKLLFHRDRLSELIESGDTFPIIMEMNITDVCNLKCNYCFCDHRGKHVLDTNVATRAVKDFQRLGGKAITFSGGGEPTAHKHFSKIAETAYYHNLEIGLITNGVFEENLIDVIGSLFKWVRISIDTVDKKLYTNIKGSDKLDIVLRNIKLLKNSKCKLGLNCNVSSDMSKKTLTHLIDKTINDVDYIQFRPVLPRFVHKEKAIIDSQLWLHLEELKQDLIDSNKVILSYDKFLDMIATDANVPFKYCEGHFFSPILDSNGDIKVCMYHPGNDNFTFGNLYKNSFEEIWKSENRKKTIEYVRSFDYGNNCQKCCKLSEINKFIDFIKYPDPNLDVNFL